MDTAALTRQLAKLLKQQAHTVKFGGAEVWHENQSIASFTLTNQSAILRALCVMAAVDEGVDELLNMHINARADELLAECTGAK